MHRGHVYPILTLERTILGLIEKATILEAASDRSHEFGLITPSVGAGRVNLLKGRSSNRLFGFPRDRPFRGVSKSGHLAGEDDIVEVKAVEGAPVPLIYRLLRLESILPW